MTHTKRHRLPQGERAITPQLAGQFPHAQPFQALPFGCQADFVTPTSIAEIEPVLRWQSGLAQCLEYWCLTLQSLHPILILIDDPSTAARRYLLRATTTCSALPLQLFVWNPTRAAWTRGGPTHHRQLPPDGPPLTPSGQLWHAPDYLLNAYRLTGLPFAAWISTYERRHSQAQHAT